MCVSAVGGENECCRCGIAVHTLELLAIIRESSLTAVSMVIVGRAQYITLNKEKKNNEKYCGSCCTTNVSYQLVVHC